MDILRLDEYFNRVELYLVFLLIVYIHRRVSSGDTGIQCSRLGVEYSRWASWRRCGLYSSLLSQQEFRGHFESSVIPMIKEM